MPKAIWHFFRTQASLFGPGNSDGYPRNYHNADGHPSSLNQHRVWGNSEVVSKTSCPENLGKSTSKTSCPENLGERLSIIRRGCLEDELSREFRREVVSKTSCPDSEIRREYLEDELSREIRRGCLEDELSRELLGKSISKTSCPENLREAVSKTSCPENY